MELVNLTNSRTEKKTEVKSDRQLTTGLFLLRCVQLGLSMDDLEALDVGMVLDMMIENSNDAAESEYNTERAATQADFDRF